MTSFQSSERLLTGTPPPSKILVYSAPHVGKTRLLMSFSKFGRVAVVNYENRDLSGFALEFKFVDAQPVGFSELRKVLDEIGAGKIPADIFGIDSMSAIYLELQQYFTKDNRDGVPLTDWVSVNRKMLSLLNFVFSVQGKTVIVTAHIADKLLREGINFKKDGQHFVSEERFRYGFDYVFRMEATGADPRKSPPVTIVEKSASPALSIGQRLPNFDAAQFYALTRPKAAPAPAAAPVSPKATPQAAPAFQDADAVLDAQIPPDEAPAASGAPQRHPFDGLDTPMARRLIARAKAKGLDMETDAGWNRVLRLVFDATGGQPLDYHSVPKFEALLQEETTP